MRCHSMQPQGRCRAHAEQRQREQGDEQRRRRENGNDPSAAGASPATLATPLVRERSALRSRPSRAGYPTARGRQTGSEGGHEQTYQARYCCRQVRRSTAPWRLNSGRTNSSAISTMPAAISANSNRGSTSAMIHHAGASPCAQHRHAIGGSPQLARMPPSGCAPPAGAWSSHRRST